MKILVVEDDPPIAKALDYLLSEYHYAVDIATDGETGLKMEEAFDYDLILLDIMLPRLNGIQLCQHLRAKGFYSPILLLTGKDGAHQKAIALNAGADDYVVKPFDAEELIARVQALLRRGGPKTQPKLTWGNLCIDPSNRKVTYGTHVFPTTPKEYAILELLLRHSQTVFSSRAILDQVWCSVESPGEEAVRVHIKELRKKFKAVGAPSDFIKTIYRVGYRLNPLYSSVLVVQPEEELTASQIADLKLENAQLRAAVIEIQSTCADLTIRNQNLENTCQFLQQELQKRTNK
ncbi:MAG: response regulator transcription factor [Cyanobacteria bacterium P01_E01_bin.6]